MGLKFNIKPLPSDKLTSSKINLQPTVSKKLKIRGLTVENKKILQRLGYKLWKNA